MTDSDMKATDLFKKTVQEYLENKAANDPLFAETYKKENKSIDECCDYIIQSMYKSGHDGFADDEIYGMAVHYYDEDDIKDIKHIACKIVITGEFKDKGEAMLASQKKAEDDRKRKLRSRKSDFDKCQMSLFD